jgi:hypothetical protein
MQAGRKNKKSGRSGIAAESAVVVLEVRVEASNGGVVS